MKLRLQEKKLEEGLLTIGFSDVAQNSFICKILENDRNYFETEIRKIWKNGKRNRQCLWRFVHDFKKGDLVIVPSKNFFEVFRIVGIKPLLLSKEENVDLGFCWNVEKACSRRYSKKEFAEIYNKIKRRCTNADISQYATQIEEIVRR